MLAKLHILLLNEINLFHFYLGVTNSVTECLKVEYYQPYCTDQFRGSLLAVHYNQLLRNNGTTSFDDLFLLLKLKVQKKTLKNWVLIIKLSTSSSPQGIQKHSLSSPWAPFPFCLPRAGIQLLWTQGLWEDWLPERSVGHVPLHGAASSRHIPHWCSAALQAGVQQGLLLWWIHPEPAPAGWRYCLTAQQRLLQWETNARWVEVVVGHSTPTFALYPCEQPVSTSLTCFWCCGGLSDAQDLVWSSKHLR